MLVVVVLDGLCSWRLPCRKTPAAGFPRKLAVLRFCLYNPSISKMSIGTLCARQPVVLTGSPTRTPLGSVGFQATTNLLFIVRILYKKLEFFAFVFVS